MSPTIGIDCRKAQDFGIGTYIRGLVGGLANLDGETHYRLLVSPEGREALGELPPNFELVVEGSRVYSLREQVMLPWRLSRLHLDLFHATHYVLPLYVPSRVVVTIHDIIHLLFPEFLPNRLAFHYARRMIRRSLERGDRIIAVSERTKTDLVEYFDVDGEKIEVVYNGVEERFREHLAEADRAALLRRLGVPDEYLLFVGNPKPHKNLDRVLAACARARELAAGELPPLVCVGARETELVKVRRWAERLGLADRVHFLGFVAEGDLPALYQGATLLLYPTLYEGFGLPVVEAMAAGTAVITSSTSALEEIGRGAAELVDPLDVEALAAAITRLVADPAARRDLAARGLKRAQKFQWSLAALRTRAIYQEVLGGEESW
ncbi:MAG: glycosyltransferase family 1 protein [Thermoanaerobaculia bacterium]|nr:glycosyltransferase family 1 protein [Thermoanaerobaculia bacterium]